MTLHYKLLPHTSRGILHTQDTPLLDIDSGFLLSFDLPEPGEYVAVLTAQDGREHTLRIGAAPIPVPSHLVKPQLIAVTVLQIKDAKPFKRWICPAIRFASLAAQNKLTIQAVEDTAGLRDEVNALTLEMDGLKGANDALRTELAKKREDLRAEMSADVAGLMDYKKAVALELAKLVEAINCTNKEIAAIKSEFSL